jgi:putative DNA-invertase from lambdoid prophage Rac
MSRLFCYLRLSPLEPTINEQLATIKSGNFDVEDCTIVSEAVYSHVPAMKRKEFSTLFQGRISAGDTLVVVKMDRLGCSASDILYTIKQLSELHIKIYVIELAPLDLTSFFAAPILSILSAIADLDYTKSVEKRREQIEFDITSSAKHM